MFSTILVPLDGSELARRALPYATTLARVLHARLILLHAYAARARTPESDPELDIVMDLSELANDLRQQGIQATTWLSYDESGPAIVQTVTDLKADLLVMSTHGRGGLSQLMFGSVAEYVVRHAGTPVVLVTDKAHPRWPSESPLRVVVPLDGSPFAEHALDPARQLAGGLGADVVLVRVPEPPITRQPVEHPVWSATEREAIEKAERYLDGVAGALRGAGLPVTTRIETGAPAASIAVVANEVAPSLVVMATHGRGTISRLLLETVASETLRRLRVPIVLVRPSPEQLDGSLPAATHHLA